MYAILQQLQETNTIQIGVTVDICLKALLHVTQSYWNKGWKRVLWKCGMSWKCLWEIWGWFLQKNADWVFSPWADTGSQSTPLMKDGRGTALELKADDLGRPLCSLGQITWTVWTQVSPHSKMGRTALALPAFQHWCWDEVRYCWKGFVNPEHHSVVGGDGGGGSSDGMSTFYCQPRGNQFISFHSYSLVLCPLWLMVHFCKSASQYSCWKKCFDKVCLWFCMQTEASSTPDR